LIKNQTPEMLHCTMTLALPYSPAARTIAVNLIFMRVLLNWNKTFLGRPGINLM